MIAVVNGAYLQIVHSQNDSDIDVHDSLSAECQNSVLQASAWLLSGLGITAHQHNFICKSAVNPVLPEDLSCTYLPHHELESSSMITTVISDSWAAGALAALT